MNLNKFKPDSRQLIRNSNDNSAVGWTGEGSRRGHTTVTTLFAVLIVGLSVGLPMSAEGESRSDKMLVIGVLEQNWDDIKMRFGKVRRSKPPTKSQFLEPFVDPRSQLTSSINSVSPFIVQSSPQTKLLVVHKIHYLANTDRLQDQDLVDLDVGRFGIFVRTQTLQTVTATIRIADMTGWNDVSVVETLEEDFRWRRLVENLTVTKADVDGTIVVSYRGLSQSIPVGASVILEDREVSVSRSEFRVNEPPMKISNRAAATREVKRTVGRENLVADKGLANRAASSQPHYIHVRLTLFNYGFK